MKVHDPFAHHAIDTDKARTLDLSEENYQAVRSETGDWFGVYLPTGLTVLLGDIPNATHEVEQADYGDAFLEACATVTEVQSVHPRYKMLEHRAGHAIRLPEAVRSAEEAAREAGYDDEVIEQAYQFME